MDSSSTLPLDYHKARANQYIEEVALSSQALQVHRLGGGVLDLGELVL